MWAGDLLGLCGCTRSNNELKIDGEDTPPQLITSSPRWHWQLTQKKLSMHELWSWHTCTHSNIHIHLTPSVCFILNFFIPVSLWHFHSLPPPSLEASRKAERVFHFFWHPCPSAYWLATEPASPCRLLIENEVHQPFPFPTTHTHTNSALHCSGDPPVSRHPVIYCRKASKLTFAARSLLPAKPLAS